MTNCSLKTVRRRREFEEEHGGCMGELRGREGKGIKLELYYNLKNKKE